MTIALRLSAVSMITGIPFVTGFARMCLSASWPSMTGMVTSRMMRSGCSDTAILTPCWPFLASITSQSNGAR